ncbi:MAG: glycerol-3-phosphate dehydrogenase/oxidase [Pirellulaceae bacterium]
MSQHQLMNRADALLRIQCDRTPWDLIVIGGGATGLGTALDAASRGYRTLLLEAEDFAKGTSSRSTKLIHGGVRYLRQGQLAMVRHSLRERGLLLDNAGPIVHPLRFVIPAYGWGKRWYYWAGLKSYDLLAGKLRLAPTRLLSASQTAELLPSLRTQQLRGGVAYSDGQFDDARLAIALAAGAAAQGATVVNYAPVRELLVANGRLRGVIFVDNETGQAVEALGKVIINATGVFSERILALDPCERPSGNNTPRIAPSQGTHLVLPGDFLGTNHAIMIPDTDDGRVLFAIPWLGSTLLGTTDIAVDTISRDPRPQSSEVDYLLEHASRYFTRAPKRSDVRSMFAGLRPLVATAHTGTSTAKLSREHVIDVAPSGLISVIGGKWTTYRQMGEDIVDLAARLGDLPYCKSVTAQIKLSDSQPSEFTPHGPEMHAPTRATIEYFVKAEMALTLEDVLARRTRMLFLDAAAAIAAAPAVAEQMRSVLGQDDMWREAQIQAFQLVAQNYMLASNK